jgi:hypothetical protein
MKVHKQQNHTKHDKEMEIHRLYGHLYQVK